MPHIPVELNSLQAIHAWAERVPEVVDYLNGSSHLNYAIYHHRYQRTGGGWKFAERVHEIRYLDTTPLTGSGRQASP